MADNNIPEIIHELNDPAFLITERFHDRPAILSTQIADRFLKNHAHILRDIGNLRGMLPRDFDNANFGRIQIKDAKGEKRPAYLLTRDAFTLLVMGMTGKTAVMWKIRYIEAFNALEAAQLENYSELAREAGYLQGRQEALGLPMVEAERRKAYLDGMKEGQKLAQKNDRLAALKKIHRYLGMGLTATEIGKILGLTRNAVQCRIARARKSGFWPATQGNLLEVE